MADLHPATLRIIQEHFTPRQDWTTDPVGWVSRRLPQVHLWSKQRAILESVRDHSNTAVQSAHSTGKSFVSSVAVAWWIDSHPPGEAFVVTSAPTAPQVKAILWREIGRRHKEGGLAGRTNLTEWYDDTGELVAFGRKPADYEPTAFQGIHARYVLVVLDEACGMPQALWDAASSLASNEYGRVLAIGNPDDPQSHFATLCRAGTWNTIKISAYDSPNFTGEPVPDRVREMLVSSRWVEERRAEWGEDSPIFTAKVLGEFPSDAEDGVVPNSWAQACRHLGLERAGDVEGGLDVSGGGADRTVLWLRQGPVAVKKLVRRGEKDPLKLAEWVLDAIRLYDVKALKVDATGVGWGLVGILDGWHRDGLHDCVTVPVIVGSASNHDTEFLNLRAEIWWMARELSRLRQWDLGVLTDDDLAELTAPKYHNLNPRGRTQVEKKDDLIKRLGQSPDSADALNLCFYRPVWEATDLTGAVAAARLR